MDRDIAVLNMQALRNGYKNISIEQVLIPENEDPVGYMQREATFQERWHGGRVAAVILKETEDLTPEDFKDMVTPSVLFLMSGQKRAIHDFIYAIENNDPGALRDLKNNNGLSDKEAWSLINIVLRLIDPPSRARLRDKDIESLRSMREEVLPYTTITPSRVLDNASNWQARAMIKEIVYNRTETLQSKPRNILLVAEGDREEYIEKINDRLECNIEDFFIVTTYNEMEEWVTEKMPNVDADIMISENTLDVVEAYADYLIGDELSEEVVYVGGPDLLKEEVNRAWLINGLLRGTQKAIDAISGLVNRETLERLKTSVIDMRPHIRKLLETRKREEEAKRAL